MWNKRKEEEYPPKSTAAPARAVQYDQGDPCYV